MKSFKHGASRIGCALLVAAALAACGGGTSQIDPFAPTRILAFGDESSTLASDGKKYSINGVVEATGAFDCKLNPIWVQTLAATFGLVFPQCNPDNTANPQGVMYAAPGAKVADLKARLDTHFATGGGFGPKDLATVLIGANDVFELYGQFPSQSRDTLIAEAKARGRLLGDQINRIANANGRVIISTLPDLGLTPFARAEKATKTDTDRAALITELTNEFNLAMRLTIINDGRLIGLVLLDEATQAIDKFPSAFGYANVTSAACLTTVALPNCTTKTLVTDASADTWLWASDRLIGSAGQARLGALAQSRAKTNPF